MTITRPVLRYHGGKFRLAPWIIGFFPPHEIYAATLAGWESHRTQSRISAKRGTALRTEIVWLNPACSAALHRSRGGLFAEVA